MPYGLPALSDHEVGFIKAWLDRGTHPPTVIELEEKVLAESPFKAKVSAWEKFLNGHDMKSRLSARYLYEHLFLAHIYFEEEPQVFFRLVRSRTSSGPIDEIATSYPFDSPGDSFAYRLRPVTNAITHKDHIPFVFNDRKLTTYRQQFVDSKWAHIPSEMPPYGRAGGNPFQTFIDVPIRARYQFFLDEAGYHVMTFIKGPVCRGPTALNVINDNFWVMFTDPEHDAMINDPELEKKIALNAAFPAESKDDILPFADYRKRYWQNVQFKTASLRHRHFVSSPAMIWTGEGTNTNATLTIYRHFDSAQVLRGLQGVTPKTVWIIDYQIFESIYYNLTAGYNVFGALLHQVNSRLFMEMSRLASEDQFLSLLPEKNRAGVRASWNRPTPDKKESLAKKAVDLFLGDVKDKLKFDYPFAYSSIPSAFDGETFDDPKREILSFVEKSRFTRSQLSTKSTETDVDLRSLTQLPAKAVKWFPDATLLRLSDSDRVFTIIHNKERYNVSLLFLEDDLRDPSRDTLDVVSGVATSYPNAFFVLNRDQLKSFVSSFGSVDSAQAARAFLKKYAVSRASPTFWENYDWFSAHSQEPLSNESGSLDLNRYMDLDPKVEIR